MWETYLKKYSNKMERLNIIEKKLKPFTSSNTSQGNTPEQLIRSYFSERFEG